MDCKDLSKFQINVIIQMIWDEVGEDEFERERAIFDLEQECQEVYRRKVNCANMSKVRLHQELVEAEAAFTHLLLSLGERSLPARVIASTSLLFHSSVMLECQVNIFPGI